MAVKLNSLSEEPKSARLCMCHSGFPRRMSMSCAQTKPLVGLAPIPSPSWKLGAGPHRVFIVDAGRRLVVLGFHEPALEVGLRRTWTLCEGSLSGLVGSSKAFRASQLSTYLGPLARCFMCSLRLADNAAVTSAARSVSAIIFVLRVKLLNFRE